MLLKQWKDIFGKPNTGVHSYRFIGVAIIDYILTIILSIVTTLLTGIPLVLTTIGMFTLGIIAHMIFGVSTNTTKYLNIL